MLKLSSFYCFIILSFLSLSGSAQRSLTTLEPNGVGGYLFEPNSNSDMSGHGHIPYWLFPNQAFEIEVINTGSTFETNVSGVVRIFDGQGTVVQTLNTNITIDTLQKGERGYLGVTNSYTYVGNPEDYTIEFAATSDDISIGNSASIKDSISVQITDSIFANDFNIYSSEFGSFDLQADTAPFSVANLMSAGRDFDLHWVRVYLGESTDTGGYLEVTLYDTTGFDIFSGFPSQSVAFGQKQITAADVARGYVTIPTPESSGLPYSYIDNQVSDGFYVVVTANDYGATRPITFRNDTTITQPQWSSIFKMWGRWFTGILIGGSQFNTTNSFHIRLGAQPHWGSIAERNLNSIHLYPNPAEEFVHFEELESKVITQYSIIDLEGRLVDVFEETEISNTSIPVGHLPPGRYFIKLYTADKEILSGSFIKK